MKNNKKPLAIMGLILIIVQLLSIIGLSRSHIDLYLDNNDLWYPNYSSIEPGLSVPKIVSAVEAGIDRLDTSFEDLLRKSGEYRTMTAAEITTARVRESLNCSDGGSFGLIVYDIVLTFSYCSIGIVGIILVLLSSPPAIKATNRHEEWQNDSISRRTM